MTEGEWLTSGNVLRLLEHRELTRRALKVRLFSCGCCRLGPWLSHPRTWKMVDASERYADNLIKPGTLTNWGREADRTLDAFGREKGPVGFTAGFVALRAIACVCTHTREAEWRAVAYQVLRFPEAFTPEVHTNLNRQFSDILRDIFGNPFRPVAFDPAWRTSTAVGLAETMYAARDFAAMPVLADALQDAGCEHADILDHCRDEKGVHVRGCWVVDLVLGKS